MGTMKFCHKGENSLTREFFKASNDILFFQHSALTEFLNQCDEFNMRKLSKKKKKDSDALN